MEKRNEGRLSKNYFKFSPIYELPASPWHFVAFKKEEDLIDLCLGSAFTKINF